MNPEKPPTGKYEQLEIDLWPSATNSAETLSGVVGDDLSDKGDDKVNRFADLGLGTPACYYAKNGESGYSSDHWPPRKDLGPSKEQVARNAAGAAAVREVVRAKQLLSPAEIRARDEKRAKQLQNPYC